MTKLSDEWRTQKWLFDELNAEFNFDVDLCATKKSSKTVLYCIDYLNNIVGSIYNKMAYPCFQEYIKENLLTKGSCFMNPPYSNPKPFIEKAWEDSKYCKIVCLVKVDSSTKWWATFWNYDEVYIIYNQQEYYEQVGPKPGCEIRFLPKRVHFDPPQELINSGMAWKQGVKWVRTCIGCYPDCDGKVRWDGSVGAFHCTTCNGKGYTQLPGPSFPSCILIFDRRTVWQKRTNNN